MCKRRHTMNHGQKTHNTNMRTTHTVRAAPTLHTLYTKSNTCSTYDTYSTDIQEKHAQHIAMHLIHTSIHSSLHPSIHPPTPPPPTQPASQAAIHPTMSASKNPITYTTISVFDTRTCKPKAYRKHSPRKYIRHINTAQYTTTHRCTAIH